MILAFFHLLPGWRSWRGVIRQRRGARRNVAQVDPQSVDLGTDKGQGRKRRSEREIRVCGGGILGSAGFHPLNRDSGKSLSFDRLNTGTVRKLA